MFVIRLYTHNPEKYAPTLSYIVSSYSYEHGMLACKRVIDGNVDIFLLPVNHYMYISIKEEMEKY